MPDYLSKPCTAFDGYRLLLSGPLIEVALAVKATIETDATRAVLVFDDLTGRVIDLDLRGSKAEIIERLSRSAQQSAEHSAARSSEPSELPKADASEPRGRGRPKLGVVAREVTLLPRQWDWLAAQPGGASAVLRRLVDEAKRNGGSRQRRIAQEAAYQFMLGIAGDLPNYDEAARALFADDRKMLEHCVAEWPGDIATHLIRLAFEARP
ncbi:DUF2239 family protein [Pseudochelatococcus lubricantis]|uniref:DUF2239 family protein n=1 Tax=Pseudochelatococcus lubricantis TaxID=1538102 RepID=UPI0035EBD888